MRFAAVKLTKELPPLRTPATEIIRRIVAGEPVARVQPAVAPKELPVELDQRVRLIGEW